MKNNEKNEKRFGSEHCVRIEFGSVAVWNCFHAWFLMYFSLLLYFCIPHSTPFPQPITTLKSPSNLDQHVFWLLILEACQVCLMLVLSGCFRSKQ